MPLTRDGDTTAVQGGLDSQTGSPESVTTFKSGNIVSYAVTFVNSNGQQVGWSPSLQTALTNTAVAIKATAGIFGGYMTLYNPNTAVTYVQLFNATSASVTVGTTPPFVFISLPGVASAAATGSAANLEVTNGIPFSTAISCAATTTPTGNTAPSNNIIGTILYI